MTTRTLSGRKAAPFVAAACALGLAAATTLAIAAAAPAAPAPPAAPQQTFATADEAAAAIVAAAATFDVDALKKILGPDGVGLVDSGDQVMDKKAATDFAALAHEKMVVARDPKNPARATMVLGNDAWPAPIPLVQKGGRWSFDTKTGRQEILYRRIGRNELDAIDVCLGFVEAQREYSLTKHDDALVNQYAQKIISTPGKHDGLAWQNPDGSWGGPVGEGIARVIAEGYTSKYQPYHGYYFKVLKGQGADAPLGAMDYVVRGAMIGGFALAAAPSDYGVTGVKTFIVSNEGIVYQKDFGPKTEENFRTMDRYDPDPSWSPVEGQ